MIKEFTGTGKTIEEATLSAKTGLNAPLTADVKIEVLTMPKKKILGLFGGCDAQVRASYDDGTKPPKQKKKTAPKKEAPKKETAKKEAPSKAGEAKKQPAKKAEKPEREAISDSDIDLDYVCSYIKTIIDGFKVNDARVTAKIVDGVIEINIDCDDYGIIIGRRGETLDSIQYLASLAVKKSADKYARVSINVGDYRAKREETLRALARKNASYVIKTGRRYSFEPMNPYERRIIHTAVQEIDGVVSRSVGSGIDRRVILEPEGGVRQSFSRGGRRGARTSAAPHTSVDPNREKRVDRADIPKFGKIEVPNE